MRFEGILALAERSPLHVEFTALARKDLNDLYEYVATTFDSPIAAHKLVDRLISNAESLATFPYLGRALNEALHRKRDYRYLVCQNYLLFYRLVADRVEVIRILNGHTGYLKTLGIASMEDEDPSI